MRCLQHDKRLQICIDQTLEILRVPREWSHSFVWKERAFSVEKNQVSISLFYLFHFIDRDSVNTFAIHKHISVSEWIAKEMWEATSSIQSSFAVIPLELQWRVFGKLGRERTRRSQLIAGAWKIRVHVGVWAWRVHCVLMYCNYLV